MFCGAGRNFADFAANSISIHTPAAFADRNLVFSCLGRVHTPQILSFVWIACVAAGLHEAARYSFTPARAVGAPPQVQPAGEMPRVIVALHPRCTCSRATVEELGRSLARAGTAVRLEVLLYQPDETSSTWAEGSLAKRVGRLPGVRIRPDPGGREARKLGMPTSGHVLVYGAEGGLRFSGGVTGARGHEGPNAGAASFLAALQARPIQAARTPVFGCGIQELPETVE